MPVGMGRSLEDRALFLRMQRYSKSTLSDMAGWYTVRAKTNPKLMLKASFIASPEIICAWWLRIIDPQTSGSRNPRHGSTNPKRPTPVRPRRPRRRSVIVEGRPEGSSVSRLVDSHSEAFGDQNAAVTYEFLVENSPVAQLFTTI